MRELIAEEIRVLLARRRMSASELARQMGVTQPYISRRLTGDTPLDVDDLGKIAHVLNVDVADLFPRRAEGRALVREAVAAGTGAHPNGRSPGSSERPCTNDPIRSGAARSTTRRPARIGALATLIAHGRTMPAQPDPQAR